MPDSSTSHVDVIVIGAGAAGLAASRTLLAAGGAIAVLEARDRIGGRAWTEPNLHGIAFDHGASFIHAEHLNPWTGIAKRLGVTTVIDPRHRKVFVGQRPATESETAAFHAARALAVDQVESAARSGHQSSIAEAVEIDGPWASQARAALGPWLLGADNDVGDACDFADGITGPDRLIRGGYGSLVQAYGRGVPVILDTPVQRIDYRGRDVLVTTTHGELRARLAIVTLPVGVLASEQVAFLPALPLAKQRAIGALPMGLLAKVALRFDGDVFGHGDNYFLHHRSDDQRSAVYQVRPLGENIVVAYVGGGLARDLEQAGEKEAAAFVLEPLVAIFGAGVRSRLQGVRHTRWGSDRFALGSYAVPTPGSSRMRAVLAKPVADRLLFAGEACATDGWAATVAGAHLSGKR
ncbi:MAG: NAD(P)/FAD-dependent oxidoreductase, partial [Pseudomonadota bacterium]